jgi:hypothetical protein
VGSVAEEVARLLDAVGGWASTAQATYAAQAAPSPEPEPEAGTARCSACGAENGLGQAVVCQLCPLCQGIGLLRALRPETVDRLADLAGAVAATLRDLATHHGEAHEPRPDARPDGRSGASRVQDIRIEDDDEPGQPDQRGSTTR